MRVSKLIGTPKQIAWAEALRSEYLAKFEADVALVGARQDEINANRPIPFPTIEDLRTLLYGAKLASTWIAGRPNYCGVIEEIWTVMAREAQTRQERGLWRSHREYLRKFGRVSKRLHASARGE